MDKILPVQRTTTVLLTVALLLIPLLWPKIALGAPLECYCVMYLRERLGVPIRGDAWTIQPNIPINMIVEGDVLVFYYPSTGVYHVGVSTKVKDGFITFAESNYHHCKPSTRTVHYTDPSIKGVYRPAKLFTPFHEFLTLPS